MEEISSASAPYEAESSKATFCSEISAKLKTVSLASKGESISHDSPKSLRCDDSLSRAASQVLWSTGTFAGPIPNGFYAVIPDRRLKELFVTIPSPEELYNLGITGLREEIILVDAEKDKKLSMLKQLSKALVKGQNSNQASVIKKLAGLVSDFYKRPSSDLSPAKGFPDEIFHPENKCIQLLGQLRHGTCRPRAILFKVLADCVGLETKLVAGLPEDGAIEHTYSYKHMSVVTVLNSVELLVDLMRFPGQLIPFSAKAVCISHISAPGETDSAGNDSCDSPLEPTSPLCGFPDGEAYDHDENLQSFFPRRTEASSYVASPRQHTMAAVLTEKIFSEPSIVNAFPRCSRRTEIAEQRTASSRSDGASTSGTRRTKHRSTSVTPKIGDDVVRAVRRMNETLKQNRRSRDKGGEVSSPYSNQKDDDFDSATDELHFHSSNHDELSEYDHSRNQFSNRDQKAVSLPSSPHHFRRGSSDGRAASDSLRTGIFYSALNKLLKYSSFLNKPLFSFEEWNIDFSELSVGTRVGIGFFGEVFRGIWNGTDVAIKVFLEQDLTTENVDDFCNEISILSRLRHPNVILFLGACMRPPHLSMVTEYMEMGSLYYLIHISGQKKKISWRKRIKILQDICRWNLIYTSLDIDLRGLMCIHRMKIIHRDLKSANCLVDKHWTVKICDFGLSQIMSNGPLRDNSSAGTPEWMAPELIRNEPFTEKCDIFSLGVIMWELCTLSRPWEGITPVQVVYAVANEGTRLEIPEGPLSKLIADCWAEPEVRPSCQEILPRLLDCEYTLC